MEQLFEEVKNGRLNLPIKSIDNLECNVYIQPTFIVDGPPPYSAEYILSIKINTLLLHEETATNLEEFTEMINKIGQLKFNKKSGYFETKVRHKYEELYSFANVVLKYQECSVCYELTSTNTMCDHQLCWICFNNLKKKTCPICRECLIAHEDSDDE